MMSLRQVRAISSESLLGAFVIGAFLIAKDAQADLCLCWAYMSKDMFSHVAAQYITRKIQVCESQQFLAFPVVLES